MNVLGSLIVVALVACGPKAAVCVPNVSANSSAIQPVQTIGCPSNESRRDAIDAGIDARSRDQMR